MTAAGGARARDPTLQTSTYGLLPATVGHVVRGTAPPKIRADAIRHFRDRVARALEHSRDTGLEYGFLAYAPHDSAQPPVAEDESRGTRDGIRWHWSERQATVALSFHTHPGDDALCIPSGIDMVGALVRGDHLVYVLTMDGRLTGWRFRHPRRHPDAVEHAMRSLGDARKLRRDFVDFLYDAFDSLRPQMLRPAYAARVTLDPKGKGGCRIRRVRRDGEFFLPEEMQRAH